MIGDHPTVTSIEPPPRTIGDPRALGGLGSGVVRSWRSTPDAVALVHDGDAWTYRELMEEARRWASVLRGRAETPAVVGILAERGAVEHVAKIAALLAGCTFVPLNPAFPLERLADVVDRAGVTCLVVDAASVLPALRLLAAVAESGRDCDVLLPESRARALRGRRPGRTSRVHDVIDLATTEPLAVERFADPDPSDLAYVLFTSGSSGRPKGVPITHGSLRSFVSGWVERHEVDRTDVFAATFDATFDLSIFGPFVAWEVGASVAIATVSDLADPAGLVARTGATVWMSVPAVAKAAAAAGLLPPDALPSLRFSLFCGEALLADTASAWQAAAPASVVVNLYGPTEATIAITEFVWDAMTSPARCVNGITPIGTPFAGHDAVVLDAAGLPVVGRARGELCLAGPQVFDGYLGATADSPGPFVVLTDGSGRTRRYYRTGDLCQWLDPDTLAYLGRLDDQVKISGYRIELGDVEAALRRAGAAEAVAIPWPVGEPSGLVAAVTGGEPDGAVLRDVLPAYMVPHTVHRLDAMPLNPNGKVDRRAVARRVAADRAAADVRRAPAGRESGVPGLDEVRRLVAHALGEDVEKITGASRLHAPATWDSLGHNAVVAALESRLGASIDPAHDHRLRSVQGILAFLGGHGPAPDEERPVDRSLRGHVVTETAITHTDVATGTILYRGYSVVDLLAASSVEEVVHLILEGELPDPEQLRSSSAALARRRVPPTIAMETLALAARARAHPLAALAAAVAAAGAERSGARGGLHVQTAEEAREAGLDLIAQLPTMTAAYLRLRRGLEPLHPDPRLGHVDDLLRMLELPITDLNRRALTGDFIVHADNGPTASTYASMVAAGAHATLHAAVTTAISVFSGARHGYASETAYTQLVPLPDAEAVYADVEGRLRAGELVVGVGHAIFGRTGDPRLAPYREIADAVALAEGNLVGMAKAQAVFDAATAQDHGAMPNYDLFGGLLYESLGLPLDIAAPLHVSFRIVGWVAHFLEERATGQPLVRPDARYVGPPRRAVVPPGAPG